MHHIIAVITKHNGKKSNSRGFSIDELKGACLTKQDAKKIGIPMDLKRKSSHDENIQTLKAHAQQAEAKGKLKTAQSEEKPKIKAKK